jgi:hypothetical protein
MNSSHINIYIYSKATFLDTWEFWGTNIFSNKVFNNQNWKSECSDIFPPRISLNIELFLTMA